MAARYFINGGVNNNWGSTSNWSTISGGSGGASVPTSADDVTFDASSPNCTIDTSARVALTLTCTNYTNTLTFNQQLSVSGNITLGSGMSFGGLSPLIVGATSTITSNGKSIDVPLNFNAATATITLSDNLTVTKPVSHVSGNALTLAGTGNLYCTSDFSLTSAGSFAGQTIFFTGTGTISTTSTGVIRSNLTINTAGTVTFSGTVRFDTGILTYTAGTVVTTGSTLWIGTTTTLNCASITWNNVTFNTGSITVTLTANLYLSGTLSQTTTGTTTLATSDIYCTGSISLTSSGAIAGRTIYLTGTGTISTSGSGPIRSNLVINTTGTITFSGTVLYSTSTLTYTAGAVVTTGSTLYINNASTTLNCAGITWNNFYIYSGGSLTVTLSADINASGTLSCQGGGASTVTISGTGNFYCSGSLAMIGVSSGAYTTFLVGRTIFMTGTGTITCQYSSAIQTNLTINTSGTITFSGFVAYSIGTLTYTAGTVVTTGSTFYMMDATTLNCASITWNNVQFNAGVRTITLSANLYLSGTLSHISTSSLTIATSDIYCSGSLSLTNTGSIFGRTIFMTGTGTISTSSSGGIQSSLNINTSGTITLSGIINYSNATITISANSIVTGAAYFKIAGSSTIDANGASIPGMVINDNVTVSLVSAITIASTLGTASTGNQCILKSSSAGVKRTVTLNPNIAWSPLYLSVTDIDSSGGAPGWTVGGTISNSNNWYSAVPYRSHIGPVSQLSGGTL